MTGFGKFDPYDSRGDESNFSWRVVQKLSETIDYQGRKIPIIKGKPSQEDESIPEPVKVCYSYVNSLQDWLNSTDAQVYLHLGIADDHPNNCKRNCITLVTEAKRDIIFYDDGYNDNDTPKPIKRGLYPSLAEYTNETSFDLFAIRKKLEENFRSGLTPKGCSASPIKLTFGVSDDAGNFLCDYLYYVSLNLATSDKRTEYPKKMWSLYTFQIL